MKAYFTRKPMNMDEAKANAAWAKAEHQEPTEVNPIATVTLAPVLYTAFCKDPLKVWDFLVPYSDQSGFTRDGADCVIIECEGQPASRWRWRATPTRGTLDGWPDIKSCPPAEGP